MTQLTKEELEYITSKTDLHQAIMDIAYGKWQAQNNKVEEELKLLPEEQRREYYKKNGWDMSDWLETLSEVEQEAVSLGKLNQQVNNGGWAQWVDNRYAADTIQYLNKALKKLPQTKEIKLIKQIVKNVESICEQNEWGEGYHFDQVDNDCEECGGTGYINDETTEDDESGETECEWCDGCGTVTDEEQIRNDETLFEDIYSHEKWNEQFFEVSDEFIEICHDYFKHKLLGTELTFKDEAEEIKTDRVKPKVKLVGRDGNAFYILRAVQKALRDVKYSKEEIDKIMEEMRSGDYNKLLQVACKYCEVS